MSVRPKQDPAFDLGRRMAQRHAESHAPSDARQPYPDDSLLGERWLEGWFSITETEPLPNRPAGRPIENGGVTALLKARTVALPIVLASRHFRHIPQRRLTAVNDGAGARSRHGNTVWDDAASAELARLHGEGFSIVDITRIMKRGFWSVQRQGYLLGLSWKGRGTRAGGAKR